MNRALVMDVLITSARLALFSLVVMVLVLAVWLLGAVAIFAAIIALPVICLYCVGSWLVSLARWKTSVRR